MSGGVATEYFGRDLDVALAQPPDYHLEHSSWSEFLGDGARALGLEGKGGTTDLVQRLDRGVGPANERLRQNWGESKDALFDCTLSFSKSISVAYAVAGEKERARILETAAGTVRAVGSHLEQHVVQTRRGKGGAVIENVGGLVMLAVWHHSSRYGDPQLHCHLLVFNAAQRKDGTWGAIHSLPIFRSKMALGALATAEMANRLKSEGVELSKSKHGFEIRGIPRKLCKELSKGRERIEQIARDLGVTSAKAYESINRNARPSKERSSRQDYGAWRRTAKAHGVTADTIRKLFGVRQAINLNSCRNNARRAVRGAVGRLAVQSSTFNEADVLRLAARACGKGQARMEDLVRAAQRELSGPGVLSLGVVRGEQRFTVPGNLEIEKRALREASRRTGDRSFVLRSGVVRQAVEAAGLDAEQENATRRATREPGWLKVLVGAAGTGKTRVMKAVHDAASSDGRRVFMIAPTGVAREALASGTGCNQCHTVAAFLLASSLRAELAHHSRMLGRVARKAVLGRVAQRNSTWLRDRIRLRRGDLVIVDEAAMVGFKELARIIQLASAAGAKLILSGDARQLAPVESGASLFSEIARRLGSIDLNKNWRQRTRPWMQELSQLLADRNTEKALRVLAGNQALHVSRDEESPMRSCVQAYLQQSPQKRSKSLILGTTRDQVFWMNECTQAARLHAGELHGPSVSIRRPAPGAGRADGETVKQRLFVGDRIVLRRNDKRFPLHHGFRHFVGESPAGCGVVNGDFGEVVAAWGTLIEVRLDRRGSSGKRLHARIDVSQYSDIDLGYAATVHRSQGATVDRAFVVIDPGRLDAELAYVALTRQSDSLHVFVHELAVGERLSDLERSMKRSRRPELATEFRRASEQEVAESLAVGLSR